MDESQISTCLELFDLPDAFTEAQLKQAYRDLVQVWHPDKHSHNERLRKKADEKMKEINQAYGELHSRLVNGRFRLERSKGWTGSQATATGRPAERKPATPPRPQPAEPAAPEPPHPAPVSDEPKSLQGNAFWLLLLGIMLLIVFVTPHGRKAIAPDASESAASADDADLSLASGIDSPPDGTNAAPFPVSPALDHKYGFKELRFGMSIDEARRHSKPDRAATNEINQLVTFWYGPSPANKLGDFPLDAVTASFFRGRLFKIEVAFSRNPGEILQALRSEFGPSHPNDSLTRDAAPLRAECWVGGKAFCAIVASWNSDRATGWDAMVMYDTALNREAQRYAADEPLRAAQLLRDDGFGAFRFGMTLADFKRKLRRPPAQTETSIAQKELVITNAADARLGRYPLSTVRAAFFQDKLYRIDLDFELHQKEIYDGFIHRFPLATDDASWSRNGESLRAKQFMGQTLTAAILAPQAATLPWDSIVLYDRAADERRREFERQAPARAAKDL